MRRECDTISSHFFYDKMELSAAQPSLFVLAKDLRSEVIDADTRSTRCAFLFPQGTRCDRILYMATAPHQRVTNILKAPKRDREDAQILRKNLICPKHQSHTRGTSTRTFARSGWCVRIWTASIGKNVNIQPFSSSNPAQSSLVSDHTRKDTTSHINSSAPLVEASTFTVRHDPEAGNNGVLGKRPSNVPENPRTPKRRKGTSAGSCLRIDTDNGLDIHSASSSRTLRHGQRVINHTPDFRETYDLLTDSATDSMDCVASVAYALVRCKNQVRVKEIRKEYLRSPFTSSLIQLEQISTAMLCSKHKKPDQIVKVMKKWASELNLSLEGWSVRGSLLPTPATSPAPPTPTLPHTVIDLISNCGDDPPDPSESGQSCEAEIVSNLDPLRDGSELQIPSSSSVEASSTRTPQNERQPCVTDTNDVSEMENAEAGTSSTFPTIDTSRDQSNTLGREDAAEDPPELASNEQECDVHGSLAGNETTSEPSRTSIIGRVTDTVLNPLAQILARPSAPSTASSMSAEEETIVTVEGDTIPLKPCFPWEAYDAVRTEMLESIDQAGYVYVFRSPSKPGFVKVGKANDINERLKQIRKGCQLPDLERVEDYVQTKIYHCAKLERLVHAELKAARATTFECNNKDHISKRKNRSSTCHTEWFKIEPKYAVQAVQRWREWLLSKPYGDIQVQALSTTWAKMITNNFPRVNEDETNSQDHETRHRKFQRFLDLGLQGTNGVA